MKKELNQEHNTMLQELRVTLPGMQMLFAFLLAMPFRESFEKTTWLQKEVFTVDLLATTLSSIFLIGPAVYHRLHWRRDVEDKDQMLKVINVLAIIGGAFLSIAIVSSIFLVVDFMLGRSWALGCTLGIALTCLGVWYALPLLRRAKEDRRERSRGGHGRAASAH